MAHFQNNSSHKVQEVLNAKRNESGKRGKGQDPTDRTTCGEPRTITHHKMPSPCRRKPLSSLSNTEYGGVGASHVGQPTPIHPFFAKTTNSIVCILY
ncbi:MAG TPA: hypothetical protein VG098_01935 [Nitrososphaera sp.]|nr:hypothetical protein [Nitrososphaera sp.]